MFAIVAPGQGAQTPGFLTPWLTDKRLAKYLMELSEICELDLVHLGTEADAETIRDTSIAQPLLVAASLVGISALFPNSEDAIKNIDIAAGHSVGELAASAFSGVLTPHDAMILVRERGRAMAQAAAISPTSMTAILGGNLEEVLATIQSHGLTAANNNGKGQIVAAGTVEQLSRFSENPPARARLIPLSVAGAFHTVHMEPAVSHLAKTIEKLIPSDPNIYLLSNFNGAVINTGAEFLEKLVNQVAHPVRWDLCMQTLAGLGVTGLLELPPSRTLTGIAKRNLKNIELFSLNTPDQLNEAQEFIAKHSEHIGTKTNLIQLRDQRIVVSPAEGKFVKNDLSFGTHLSSETQIGYIENDKVQSVNMSTNDGVPLEWLVKDGDVVTTGQSLLRLDPNSR